MRTVLLALIASVCCAQTILICGTPKGCTFAGLGAGVSYDAASNKIVSTAPAPPPSAKLQVDTFTVNCAAPTNCPNGTPQTAFRTTLPVKQFVIAVRAIAQAEGIDYDKTVNADGTWSIVFRVPADTGSVILLYTTCGNGPC